MVESQALEALRLRFGLRINELKFVPGFDQECGTGFRTDTQPVDASRRMNRAVGFRSNFKPGSVQGLYQLFIHLQKGFPSGKDDKAPPFPRPGPSPFDGRCKRLCGRKASARRAVHADKIGIAEAADCRCAVGFTARPKVTSREATKDGGTPGIPPLALERIEDLLDGV